MSKDASKVMLAELGYGFNFFLIEILHCRIGDFAIYIATSYRAVYRAVFVIEQGLSLLTLISPAEILVLIPLVI